MSATKWLNFLKLKERLRGPPEWPSSRALKDPRHDLGRCGERQALAYLRKKSFTVWTTNWRCRLGEIDIIASQDRTLVFAEVKTRACGIDALFGPFAAITPRKQVKLKRLAAWFIQANKVRIKRDQIKAFRFDVLGVYKQGNKWTIRHEEQAF